MREFLTLEFPEPFALRAGLEVAVGSVLAESDNSEVYDSQGQERSGSPAEERRAKVHSRFAACT